ncbi:MAG: NYN domain-containing protein [Mesorhizobium sp.]|uniref:NYN domain-containing protein n=1 Tax=Mesorhizobium sp. TaxID=1871066 RepID=UPI000FE5A61E|nr:NYN domain-containing protein [Mesorhizobium sp.]RWK79643.1 MAG: NYN domain-containing protein [Mesorhizobium sp.]RWK82419.1 MAG: NYN domain-containing protein [Mesorhizobium sp.]RWL08762.1 MAG: NYN domain-containing protein [Mesorhizobium sp.]
MHGKYAILIDGGFVKKKLRKRNDHFPTVAEIEAEITRIKLDPNLADYVLMRVYFYDAPPASGLVTNPIDSVTSDLSTHPHHAANISLQQALELQPNMALRMGETVIHGWELGEAAIKNLKTNGARAVTANDFVPNIEQKGVDLRIGLDIARLAIRQLVDIIVVVTGDSDMVPAFKFARREGLRVYLDHMAHGVKRDLKAHVDLVL